MNGALDTGSPYRAAVIEMRLDFELAQLYVRGLIRYTYRRLLEDNVSNAVMPSQNCI